MVEELAKFMTLKGAGKEEIDGQCEVLCSAAPAPQEGAVEEMSPFCMLALLAEPESPKGDLQEPLSIVDRELPKEDQEHELEPESFSPVSSIGSEGRSFCWSHRRWRSNSPPRSGSSP